MSNRIGHVAMEHNTHIYAVRCIYAVFVVDNQIKTRHMIRKCTGCGRLSTEPLGLNSKGEPFLACCPDNNYRPITAVEWFAGQLGITKGTMFERAKEMESRQLENAQDSGYILGLRDAENEHNQNYGGKK